MSKTAKALIVAATLILLGAVIGGIGFFFGGWDTLTENYGPDAVENSQSWSDPVTKLEISTVSDNVRLLPSEDGKVRVDWKDTRYGHYEVSLERGTLEICYRDMEQKPHFDFGEEKPRTVAVYLPESDYDSLLLTTVSGNAASSGFSFGRTEITTASGQVGLESGDLGETRITTTSGDVVLDGCDTSTAEIKTTSGNVVLHDHNAAATKIVTTSGEVGLGNGFFGETTVETGSGDVVLDCFDASETEINTTSGSVIGTVTEPKLFYAESVSGTAEYPVNDYSTGYFTVHTDSGDVKISYQ